MNPETLTALKDSIEHWRRLSNGNLLPFENIGVTNCALCQLFYVNTEESLECLGCPVYVRTGFKTCSNSPYVAAYQMMQHGMNSDEFRAAATAELLFLESLLPTETL